MQIDSFFQGRIEEIPNDQIELTEEDRLVPVAHYDNHVSKLFGTPFFVKIRQGDSIKDVCQRIRAILELSDFDYNKVCT